MTLPDKNSYANLGGTLINYSPVTDPNTDLGADSSNSMRSDVASMTRTAIRAYARFSSGGAECFIDNGKCDAVYGNNRMTYPTGAVTSANSCTITFPEKVVNDLGEEVFLNLTTSFVNIVSSSSISSFTLRSNIVAPNQVEVSWYGASDFSFSATVFVI